MSEEIEEDQNVDRELRRAVGDVLVEARRQRDRGPCSGCDPGNEGAEVWGELVEKLEAAMKVNPKSAGGR